MKRSLLLWSAVFVTLAVFSPAFAGPQKLITTPPEGWTWPVEKLHSHAPTAADVLTPPEPPAKTPAENATSQPAAVKPPVRAGIDYDIAQTPPKIEFGILPGQWPLAKLWSNWGDSLYAADGNFYCSIGDHAGPHGNSYVYRVDPRTGEMKMVVDFAKAAGIPADKYASGKIHCRLMQAPDGWIYFAGYVGTGPTSAEVGYIGDWLMRYNPETGKTEKVDTPCPNAGTPCSILHGPSMTLYGLTSPGDTMPEPRHSHLYAYDLKNRKQLFYGGPRPNMPRALLLAADGRVYYSTHDAPDTQPADKNEASTPARPTGAPKPVKGTPPPKVSGWLVCYDPKTNSARYTDVRVPGNGVMRAASPVNKDGVAYGISMDGVVFTFDTKTEQLREFTTAFPFGALYIASVRLDPSEKYMYYIPSAHGRSYEHGTAVVQLNLQTGRKKVLAFLNEYIKKNENYNLGGTFGIALSSDGSTLFACFNGRRTDGTTVSANSGTNMDFDLCSVVIVHIPESERQ